MYTSMHLFLLFGIQGKLTVTRIFYDISSAAYTNNSNYLAELIPLTLIYLYAPHNTNIEIYTDSEACIKAINSYHTLTSRKQLRTTGRHMLETILQHTTKDIKLIHINSHTKKKDFWSLGNERADELANKGRSQRQHIKTIINYVMGCKFDFLCFVLLRICFHARVDHPHSLSVFSV